jgi:hypothetical protein
MNSLQTISFRALSGAEVVLPLTCNANGCNVQINANTGVAYDNNLFCKRVYKCFNCGNYYHYKYEHIFAITSDCKEYKSCICKDCSISLTIGYGSIMLNDNLLNKLQIIWNYFNNNNHCYSNAKIIKINEYACKKIYTIEYFFNKYCAHVYGYFLETDISATINIETDATGDMIGLEIISSNYDIENAYLCYMLKATTKFLISTLVLVLDRICTCCVACPIGVKLARNFEQINDLTILPKECHGCYSRNCGQLTNKKICKIEKRIVKILTQKNYVRTSFKKIIYLRNSNMLNTHATTFM